MAARADPGGGRLWGEEGEGMGAAGTAYHERERRCAFRSCEQRWRPSLKCGVHTRVMRSLPREPLPNNFCAATQARPATRRFPSRAPDNSAALYNHRQDAPLWPPGVRVDGKGLPAAMRRIVVHGADGARDRQEYSGRAQRRAAAAAVAGQAARSDKGVVPSTPPAQQQQQQQRQPHHQQIQRHYTSPTPGNHDARHQHRLEHHQQRQLHHAQAASQEHHVARPPGAPADDSGPASTSTQQHTATPGNLTPAETDAARLFDFEPGFVTAWSPSLLAYFPLGCVLAVLRMGLWVGGVIIDAEAFKRPSVASAFLRLLGFRCRWQGVERLPPGRHIMVTNHVTPADLLVRCRSGAPPRATFRSYSGDVAVSIARMVATSVVIYRRFVYAIHELDIRLASDRVRLPLAAHILRVAIPAAIFPAPSSNDCVPTADREYLLTGWMVCLVAAGTPTQMWCRHWRTRLQRMRMSRFTCIRRAG
eukprot:362822-Chlamydomonas_euryale.AAC.16